MERAEFEALYVRLRTSLYSYAAARLSAQSALDIVHDTFEVVWSKRQAAPATPEEQAAWCFGIARNKVLQDLERVQRKHHDNRFAADHDAAPLAAADNVADSVLDSAVSREIWRHLSADDKELLLLVTATEISGAALAEMLGITHAAYRRRLSRLRERIAVAEDRINESEPAGGLR